MARSVRVGAERVALATAPVQGRHQLPAQTFIQRVLLDERLERTDHILVMAEGEVGSDVSAMGLDQDLRDVGGGGLGEREVRQRSQRVAAVQRDRLLEQRQRPPVVTVEAGISTGVDEPLEPVDVDVVGRQRQSIPRRMPHDDVTTEQLPQHDDLGLQGVDRIGQPGVVPQLLEQSVVRDVARYGQREHGQQRLDLEAAHRRQAALGLDLDRAEQPDPHHR